MLVCLRNEYGCGYVNSSEDACIDSVHWALAYLDNFAEEVQGQPDEVQMIVNACEIGWPTANSDFLGLTKVHAIEPLPFGMDRISTLSPIS